MSTLGDLVLEQAYEILSSRPWHQGDLTPLGLRGLYLKGDDMPVCLIGAIDLAAYRMGIESTPREVGRRVALAIDDLPPHGVKGRRAIAAWNDDPDTTKEDVLLALKRARYDFEDEP